MACLVFYVTRQRRGWSVEHDGSVRSGHPTREEAILRARDDVENASRLGNDARVRIQEDAGVWREDRSFAPSRGPV